MIQITTEAKSLNLEASNSFWLLDDATINMISGGCGAGWMGNLGLFDRMYLLDVKLACIIHDYEYAIGKTQENKEMADIRFFRNLMKIINKKSKINILKVMRRYRALTYYNLVDEFGNDAFYEASII